MSINVITLDQEKLEEIARQAGTFAAAAVMENAVFIAPEIMTKRELGTYLRCDRSKIDRLMKEGLPFEKLGSTPRFRKSDVDLWLKGNL